ncbi:MULTISPECIES: VacJ family lipoprotein [Methylomonas]|uniref:MlaA family lipoprotein n=1 Tax=Methylomonas TaxID=416 RepID=UPI0007C90590|nr:MULTISPECIES: VacJ family lipoprotein [Methylomonas]ANE54805.1 ABC transporter [Methylomonas sp. DH-1]ATG89510.1 ABC transporter [Methylomonas koyamae]
MFNPCNQGKSQACLMWAMLFSGALSVGGCASTEPKDLGTTNIAEPKSNSVDPYEGFNRSMYSFNMGLDKYLLKPVADGYKFITPDFMETGVTNFFTNLKGINVVLNDFLQGKVSQGASDTGRFLTNSTIGLLGLFDVASGLGMQGNVEDFGQTLAVWGVDQGAYLVLPILGPTTIRDGSASILDRAANPGTYVPGTGIVEGINDRANAEGALNFIDEAALDPYVFTRESFLQYRQNLVNDGKHSAEIYDIDVEDAIGGEAKPAKSEKAADKAKSSNGSDLLGPQSSLKPVVDSAAAEPDAFDNMSRSFARAESQFEQASAKMDEFSSKKKVRRKRR